MGMHHAPLEKRAIWNYNDYPLTFQKKKRTFIKKREKLQKNMAQKVINDKEITEYYIQKDIYKLRRNVPRKNMEIIFY